jgi:hypothetical protein
VRTGSSPCAERRHAPVAANQRGRDEASTSRQPFRHSPIFLTTQACALRRETLTSVAATRRLCAPHRVCRRTNVARGGRQASAQTRPQQPRSPSHASWRRRPRRRGASSGNSGHAPSAAALHRQRQPHRPPGRLHHDHRRSGEYAPNPSGAVATTCAYGPMCTFRA